MTHNKESFEAGRNVGFIQGIGHAVAQIISQRSDYALAIDLAGAAAISLDEFTVHCDKADLDNLCKLFAQKDTENDEDVSGDRRKKC